jgi:hypothetical protein
MLLLAAEKAFYVSPSLGMIIWLVIGLIALLCLPVVVAKARWGWLLVGVFTGGIGWIVGATQPARPESLLRRWRDRSSPA